LTLVNNIDGDNVISRSLIIETFEFAYQPKSKRSYLPIILVDWSDIFVGFYFGQIHTYLRVIY